jgi:SET domain-containing protein
MRKNREKKLKIQQKIEQKIINNTKFNFEVKLSQIENSGRGVFLHKNENIIKEGTFIGFYHGEWKLNSKNTSPYSFYINDKLVIDIDFEKPIPITAIFNDAIYSDYSNNIISKILLSENDINKITNKNKDNYNPNNIIGLYALRDIYPEEELFFDYGTYYWKSW